MSYYYTLNSIEFINYGITEGYKIPKDNLAYDFPLFVIDDNKVKSFYLVKDCPAISVIDSGILDKEEFDKMMRGVGFENEFIKPKKESSIFAISRTCEPDLEYAKRVAYFLKTIKDIK